MIEEGTFLDFSEKIKHDDELMKLYEAFEIWLNSSYLFSWDNVPGNDRDRLLRFLKDDLDIGWAENAEIRKAFYDKTIHIFTDENSAEIMIDVKKKKATLKIRDGRIYLRVTEENGKLNIYNNGNVEKAIKCFHCYSELMFHELNTIYKPWYQKKAPKLSRECEKVLRTLKKLEKLEKKKGRLSENKYDKRKKKEEEKLIN